MDEKTKLKHTEKTYTCNHCGNEGLMLDRGSYVFYFEPTDEYNQYILLECPTCHKPSILNKELNDEVFDEEFDTETGTDVQIPVDKMIYPLVTNLPDANSNIPDEIKKIYNEARSIFNLSPKGSCALLRLAIEKLCISLGGNEKDKLNEQIKKLVKKGLSSKIQKSLDIVRVIGNNAVHPGLIDIDDNPDIARSLFDIVNIIAEEMISGPKKIDDIYDHLPDSYKKSIEKRDSKSSGLN